MFEAVAMKIVFLIPDMGYGGAERVVSIISKELAGFGHLVDIVCLFGSQVQYEISSKVELLDFSSFNSGLFRRVSHLRGYLKQQKKVNKKIVVIAFQSSCLNTVLLASLFTGVKVVSTERSNPLLKGTSIVDRIKASIPFLLSNLGVFQTPDASNYYRIMPVRKRVVISNPITSTDISWNNIIIPSGLISVCRLHPGKNISMSLAVISKLKKKYPNIHLDIFGSGSIETVLKTEAKDLGVENNVSFKGNTSQVINELSTHSIYVSTSNYEGVSNSLLEAMSVGIPIICTDCPIGGARMMLKDNCGMLSPVNDIESFVNKLDYLLSHPAEALEMAKKAKARTAFYSPSNIAKEWENVIVNLF